MKKKKIMLNTVFSQYSSFAFGLLYIYLFGIIILSFRFFALGKSIDMSFLFIDKFLILKLIFIITCYSPAIIWLLFKILIIYKKIRDFLWKQLVNFYYPIHLFLLNYSFDYFFILSKIHKFTYFLYYYCIRNLNNHNNWPTKLSKIWFIIEYLYLKPQIWLLFIFSFIFFEIIISKKLFFSLYILFIFICLKTIFTNLFFFQKIKFVDDCCHSNYLYKNFSNPRYPIYFWFLFDGAIFFYSFQHQFSLVEEIKINEKKKLYFIKIKLMEKTTSRTYRDKLFLYSPQRFSYNQSIAYLYYFFNYVRY